MKKHKQDPNAITIIMAKYVVVLTASKPPFCTLMANAMMEPMRDLLYYQNVCLYEIPSLY